MRDNSNLGCIGFILLAIGIYALWVAVLWIGLPLAAVGAYFAYTEFKKAGDPERKQTIHRNNALALAGGSAILASVAIWGNIATDKGPFSRSAEEPASTVAAETEVMPSASDCQAARAAGEVQSYGQIKAACERMTAGGSGASLAANACFAEEVDLLRKCGVEIVQSPF
ncbi:hypothetical protein AOA14_06250 [Sphingopyxis terrae subsp. terrae NBRC 15098]|uniref:Uncharacterized protein n=1 Tax=Sphingopyxis terrae subsp. terrae NBRC 15098 TaxID=1219058 RepID=A0A142VWN8_9SPHN|nr:hypothetical protein [Sphingopyxis terrae]AMU94206.1 hypothetical protein AOA14_06250 [Sphingopyxis terrae subsp. terrae NBRC 15098]